jgi:hypothetical protein
MKVPTGQCARLRLDRGRLQIGIFGPDRGNPRKSRAISAQQYYALQRVDKSLTTLDRVTPPVARYADRGGAMRCLACAAEMRLIEVINDGRMAVTGFERHISKCSGCSRIRWRWEVAGNRVPIATLPTKPCPSTILKSITGPRALPAAWTAAIEKLRSRQAALDQRAAPARSDDSASFRPIRVAEHTEGDDYTI